VFINTVAVILNLHVNLGSKMHKETIQRNGSFVTSRETVSLTDLVKTELLLSEFYIALYLKRFVMS